MQLDDHALAQGALGRQQALDAELRGKGVEQRQAAGDDGFAVGLEARQVEPVDVAGIDAALEAARA